MARIVRPVEERIAEIDKKINSYKALIASLEEREHRILNPKPRKKIASVSGVIAKAKEAGMKPEEIAKKLGIEI